MHILTEKDPLVFHFQQSHLSAEHGLAGVQRGSGTRKAAEFGYAHKVFELLEIHRSPFLRFLPGAAKV